MLKQFRGLLAALVILAAPAWAEEFQLGQHYGEIYPVPAPRSGDEVQVEEFFMYLCPHCYHFEPALEKWLEEKPDNIIFSQVPAMFGALPNLHAKMFYALEAIGEKERLHAKIFAEIHDKGNRLPDRDAIDAFLEKEGVDIAKFREAMNSFGLSAKTNRAYSAMRTYGIRSVPTIVVDGRYRTGNVSSQEQRIEVVKFLVDKVLQERAASMPK